MIASIWWVTSSRAGLLAPAQAGAQLPEVHPLTGAIGPQDHRVLARLQRQVEILEHQAVAEPGIHGPKIDALLQPHPQLDGLYDSIEDSLRDAITLLEGLGPEAAKAPIGLEASAPLIGSTSGPERRARRSARNRLMFALVLLVFLAPGGFRPIAMAFRILGSPVSHPCG